MGRIYARQGVAKSLGRSRSYPPARSDHRGMAEVRVFVGPSWLRRKSTLLRLIAGLEDVSAGEDPHRRTGTRQTYRPPSVVLPWCSSPTRSTAHMSVRKNIAFPLRMAGLDAAEQERRVRAAADCFSTSPTISTAGPVSCRAASASAWPSGGPNRARAVPPSSSNEPLSNLDAALRVGMRLEISELHNRLKTTMIYVTHDQVEAMTMADKIVVLRAGNIEQVGSPLELYRAPRNLFVAGLHRQPEDEPDRRRYCRAPPRHDHRHPARSTSRCLPRRGNGTARSGVSEHLGSDTFFHVAWRGHPRAVTVRVGGEVFASSWRCDLADAQWPIICNRFDTDGLRVA